MAEHEVFHVHRIPEEVFKQDHVFDEKIQTQRTQKIRVTEIGSHFSFGVSRLT